MHAGSSAHRPCHGDTELLAAMEQRFEKEVQGQLGGPPRPYVLKQPPHPQAFGEGVAFDAPWQMAALVHGLHAMHQMTGKRELRDAVVDTALVMAGPGWLEGKGPKYLVSAADPTLYTMPVGYGPLEGTALMETGAFVLAEEMARDSEHKQLFRGRAAFLLAPYEKMGPVLLAKPLAASPWLQLYLDRRHGGRSLEDPRERREER